MGLTASVAAASGIKIIPVGSLELVAGRDVDAFLLAAKNERVAILGIEGFRFAEGQVIPDVDAIADFSGCRFEDDVLDASHAEAHRFLDAIDRNDMYFEFEAERVAEVT